MRVRDRRGLTLRMLDQAGPNGLTAVELGALAVVGHGASSAALSHLHDQGLCARLADRRDGSSVYVHWDHLGGRQTAARGHNQKSRLSFDKGFAIGLEEGAAQADQVSFAEGYRKGWDEGTAALGRKLSAHLEEMARAIRAEQGMRPAMLTDRSWMVHPQHTLAVVTKALRRMAQPQPELPLPDGVVDLTMMRESR